MFNTTPRTMCIAIALAALAFPLSGNAAEKIRIALGAVAAELSPAYAAQELGYYKAEGLDVDLTTYSGGGPAQEALAAGAADMYSNSPSGAALAIAKGVKQKIVAQISGAPFGFYLIVRSDSQVKTVDDLSGKKIAITTKGGTTDALASWLSKTKKVDVLTVPVGGGGVLPNLKARQVDASVVWPPVSFKALGSGEYRQVVDFGAAMGNIAFDSWVASDAAISNNPEGIKRFLKAFMRAAKYMQTNEEWAIGFMKKYHDESDTAVIKKAYDALVKTISLDGSFDEEKMKQSIDFAKFVGLTTIPPYEQVVTKKFIPITQ